MTDRHFLVAADLAIRTQASATKSPVYYYLFEYVPEDRLEFGGPPGKVISHLKGLPIIGVIFCRCHF